MPPRPCLGLPLSTNSRRTAFEAETLLRTRLREPESTNAELDRRHAMPDEFLDGF